MKIAVAVLTVCVILPFIFLIGLAASAPQQGNKESANSLLCSSVTVPAGGLPTGTIAGYSGDQLANAAQVLSAGATLGLGERDQTIGVMTAMGESGLRVIDYGDGAGPDSRGLFQQRDNGAWGTYADRMDPFISATNFFKAMMKVPGRDVLPPTLVANATQINKDPNHYAKYWDAAVSVVSAMGGGATCATGAGSGAPGGDPTQLAAALVAKIDAGRITGLSGGPLDQIRWAATGENSAECSIDYRILQVLTIASDTFESVGVSSINRLCTKTLAGAGTRSRHYMNGGGHAVDFYGFNGKATNGADANAVTLIRTIDTLMPAGSMIGQVQCRSSAGTSLVTRSYQFSDGCNHLHIDVDPNSKVPLLAGT